MTSIEVSSAAASAGGGARIVGNGSRTAYPIRRQRPSDRRVSSVFDGLFENCPDPMIVTSREGTIVAVNPATERLFGYRRTELIGRPVELLAPGGLGQAHSNGHAPEQASPGLPAPWCIRASGERRDGTTVPLSVTMHPPAGPAGNLVLAVMRDVTGFRTSSDVLAEVVRLRAVEALVAFQGELALEVSTGRGVGGIATALARHTRRVVTVEDAGGRVLATAGAEELATAGAEEIADVPPISAPCPADLSAATHAVAVRDGDRWVAVARPNNSLLGLISLLDTTGEAEDAELRALERAATVLAMELFRLRSIAETHLGFWGDLASDLLTNPDGERIRSRAVALGYDLDRTHRAVLIQASAGRADDHVVVVARVARQFGLREVLLTVRPSGIVVLAPDDLDWAEFARELAIEARTSVRIGVGGRYGAEALSKSFADAGFALKLLESIGAPSPVALFDDLGVWRVLAHHGDPAELKSLIDGWIGPLIAYDEKHGSELVKTLGVFLSESCAVATTASRLFVHRNTLKYRLSRISALTGWDLGDPEHRFHLDLACRARMTLRALA